MKRAMIRTTQTSRLFLARLQNPHSPLTYGVSAPARYPGTSPTRHPLAASSKLNISRTIMSTAQPVEPRYSLSEDRVVVRRELDSILATGWELDAEGMGVKKQYAFKSYFKAVSFVNLIAAESAVKKHHAVITLRFGSVDVHWTTHNPRGLSQLDTAMAQYCDRGAEVSGVVEQGAGQRCGPP